MNQTDNLQFDHGPAGWKARKPGNPDNSLRILYSWGAAGWSAKRARNIVSLRQAAGWNITAVNHRKALGEDKTYTPQELRERLEGRSKPMIDLYDQIRSFAQDHDILIVEYDNVYLPEFLDSLDIFKVHLCGDDPEGSDVRSKPYVRYFDLSVAQTLGFDADNHPWQKYEEWGARAVSWSPIGVCQLDYDPFLSRESVIFGKRTKDAVFVGSAGFRAERIQKLRKHIPIEVFGTGWGRFRQYRKSHPLRIFGKLTGLPRDPYLPAEKLVPLYKQARIGLNVHPSYGVGNRRTYALAANGVMQLSDQPRLMSSLYEPDREVILFDSFEDAVDKANYYLNHDDERKDIAANAFDKIMSLYSEPGIFDRLTTRVLQEMTR